MPGPDETRRILSRRGFMKLGLGVGAGALLLGGGVVAMFRVGPPGPGKQVLSDDEAAFLEALAEVYLPPGNDLGLDARSLDVPGSFDAHLAGLPKREQRVLRGLFTLFDQWPRLSFSSGGRFARLPLADRVEVIRAWEESPRQTRHGIAGLLRVLLGLHLFSSPAALAAVGHRYGCGSLG